MPPDLTRPAWLEIDVSAYQRNLRALAGHCGRPVVAVIKANGYGHGLTLMGRAALETGCPALAVAIPEEGAELRAAGIEGRIIVLAPALESQAALIAAMELEPVVVRAEMIRALSDAATRLGRTIGVHVKADSGMTRVGVSNEEALALCGLAETLEGVTLAGLMTHFATAEEADPSGVEAQWAEFAPLAATVRERFPHADVHAANSPAAVWFPPSWGDFIRGGIVTFGIPPADRPMPFAVEPVATLKAQIAQVREVPAGRSVSYGRMWTTERPSRLALVALGYADGLLLPLSNRGCALIQGQRAPMRGRICMDQVVLDVTDLPPVEPGAEAVFLGRQGEGEITVSELAREAGTILHEVVTRLGPRLPRIAV